MKADIFLEGLSIETTSFTFFGLRIQKEDNLPWCLDLWFMGILLRILL